jgi:hypothetical protein
MAGGAARVVSGRLVGEVLRSTVGRELSHVDLLVLIVLAEEAADRTGLARVPRAVLAERVRASQATVDRSVRTLVDLGLIERVQKAAPGRLPMFLVRPSGPVDNSSTRITQVTHDEGPTRIIQMTHDRASRDARAERGSGSNVRHPGDALSRPYGTPPARDGRGGWGSVDRSSVSEPSERHEFVPDPSGLTCSTCSTAAANARHRLPGRRGRVTLVSNE